MICTTTTPFTLSPLGDRSLLASALVCDRSNTGTVTLYMETFDGRKILVADAPGVTGIKRGFYALVRDPKVQRTIACIEREALDRFHVEVAAMDAAMRESRESREDADTYDPTDADDAAMLAAAAELGIDLLA